MKVWIRTESWTLEVLIFSLLFPQKKPAIFLKLKLTTMRNRFQLQKYKGTGQPTFNLNIRTIITMNQVMAKISKDKELKKLNFLVKTGDKAVLWLVWETRHITHKLRINLAKRLLRNIEEKGRTDHLNWEMEIDNSWLIINKLSSTNSIPMSLVH